MSEHISSRGTCTASVCNTFRCAKRCRGKFSRARNGPWAMGLRETVSCARAPRRRGAGRTRGPRTRVAARPRGRATGRREGRPGARAAPGAGVQRPGVSAQRARGGSSWGRLGRARICAAAGAGRNTRRRTRCHNAQHTCARKVGQCRDTVACGARAQRLQRATRSRKSGVACARGMTCSRASLTCSCAALLGHPSAPPP